MLVSANKLPAKRTLRTARTLKNIDMNTAELKTGLALDKLLQELALAEEVREKRLAATVRFVRRCEATGPAKDMIAQSRRDQRLCQLLAGYDSEIIGILEFVPDQVEESNDASGAKPPA